MRKAGIATVVTVALLVALPACGKKTDEAARAAGVTPATALGFLSVSLDPSIEQKRNLVGIARRFPEAEVKEDFEENRDDLLSAILEEAGLDYEEDVKPWLGSELALAVLPGGAAPTPLVAVLIEQDDADAAKAAMDKANARAQADGAPPIAYRLVDDFVVATDGSDAARGKQTLDAFAAQADREDGDLSESKEFAEVVDELHGDRLLLGWINGKAALEELARVFEATDAPFGGFVQDAVPAAFDIHAERSALVMEAVARATTEANHGDPQLTEGLPEGSFGALTVFDVKDVFRDGLQAAFGASGRNVLAELKNETGIDLDADILSWMGGESVIVAAPNPGGRGFPNLGFVVEPSDRAAAQAALPKIRDALARSGTQLVEQQVAGATAYVFTGEASPGVQPAMALFEDRFVVASSVAYLETLAKDASPSFGEGDAYESVLGESTSDSTRMQLLLDADAIRETFEGFVSDEDRATYEQDTKPNLEPLDALGFVLHRDGDFDRAELKLTFD